jgi:hypothetical protein
MDPLLKQELAEAGLRLRNAISCLVNESQNVSHTGMAAGLFSLGMRLPGKGSLLRLPGQRRVVYPHNETNRSLAVKRPGGMQNRMVGSLANLPGQGDKKT